MTDLFEGMVDKCGINSKGVLSSFPQKKCAPRFRNTHYNW